MGEMCFNEMSVSKTNNVGRVTSLKSEDLNYIAAKAYNLPYLLNIMKMKYFLYNQTEIELRVLVG